MLVNAKRMVAVDNAKATVIVTQIAQEGSNVSSETTERRSPAVT